MPARQMFPADQETVNTIPAAATNVWWIDLVPGEQGGYPTKFVSANGKVFFVAGSQLWVTDGTSAGTRQLTTNLHHTLWPDLYYGPTGPDRLTAAGSLRREPAWPAMSNRAAGQPVCRLRRRWATRPHPRLRRETPGYR